MTSLQEQVAAAVARHEAKVAEQAAERQRKTEELNARQIDNFKTWLCNAFGDDIVDTIGGHYVILQAERAADEVAAVVFRCQGVEMQLSRRPSDMSSWGLTSMPPTRESFTGWPRHKGLMDGTEKTPEEGREELLLAIGNLLKQVDARREGKRT